ncbi:MAG: hypothetical protein ABIE43_00925 [Patescibacteria group bacterium]
MIRSINKIKVKKTEKMFKQKMFLCSCVLSALVLLTGCSSDNKTVDNNQSSNEAPAQNNGRGQVLAWREDFSEGSLDDLEIGKNIMVMGTENSDGSVASNQIIIGNSPDDFNNLAGNMLPGGRRATSTDNLPSGQSAPNTNGQQPDFSQFQNMSEEERANLRAQRTGNSNLTPEERASFAAGRTGGQTGNGRFGAGQNMARINGEIIDKDDAIITLKLKDGGSKLIFFSEKTSISIIKE